MMNDSQFPQKSDCRYCSVVAKAKAVAPIGTAIVADLWIAIEVPYPWAKNPWQRESPELIELFESLVKHPRLWRSTRILAIAPDQEYSQQGHRHVLCYRRPKQQFLIGYDRDAFCVPVTMLAQLVKKLLFQQELTEFVPYRQNPVRSLFICTHTHYDLACGRFGKPLFNTLRRDYAMPTIRSSTDKGKLQVWQTSHFGGHHFAPTLIDFPQGQFWGHLETEILPILIHRQGDLSQLLPCYRGWGAWSQWGQVVERELWQQVGWSWLEIPKAERILRADGGKLHDSLLRWLLQPIPTIQAQTLRNKLEQKLTFAEVEIRVGNNEEGLPRTYRARVEANQEVMTSLNSGKTANLYPVKQYQVSVMS